MATAKTLVSVEPIDAMIQKAQNLLAEAQSLGQQYVAHSQDIVGSGWGGDAATTSVMVSEQVNNDLVRKRARATICSRCTPAPVQALHRCEACVLALLKSADTFNRTLGVKNDAYAL
jgi:hypothetical protein